VLDTVRGQPAAGMALALYVREADPKSALGEPWQLLRQAVTNADGRVDGPLLQGEALQPRQYRLVFEVEAYFRAQGVSMPDVPFLTQVPLDFGIADAGAHYHVPLLVSPWAYSTYRGS
jgi:5-hydroxyisourate hydrolase